MVAPIPWGHHADAAEGAPLWPRPRPPLVAAPRRRARECPNLFAIVAAPAPQTSPGAAESRAGSAGDKEKKPRPGVSAARQISAFNGHVPGAQEEGGARGGAEAVGVEARDEEMQQQIANGVDTCVCVCVCVYMCAHVYMCVCARAR